MFTEQSLREYPQVVKAFMGLPAERFWELVQQVQTHLPAYERERLARPDRPDRHHTRPPHCHPRRLDRAGCGERRISRPEY